MTSNHTETDNAAVADVPVVATAPSLVNTYVAKYQSLAKKTALSTVELGSMLIEAKGALASSEFSEFCKGVGLKEGGSTFSKLKSIGEAETRLKALGDRLPHSWTTLYILARIPAGRFAEIEARIECGMTAADVRQLLPAPPSKPQPVRTQGRSAGSVVSITLGKNVTREAFLKALESLKQSFEFEIVDPADNDMAAPEQENAPLKQAA